MIKHPLQEMASQYAATRHISPLSRCKSNRDKIDPLVNFPVSLKLYFREINESLFDLQKMITAKYLFLLPLERGLPPHIKIS